jgi:hypothetical protein
MDNTVIYEVTLDHPSSYVCFEGPKGLSENEILSRAIEELTQKTTLWSVKITEK